jgi:5-methylcytosine-specific restriction endonuclease McrA
MEVISKEAAKSSGLTKYYTGAPCKHGHREERYVSDGRCVGCVQAKWGRYYSANKDKIAAYQKGYVKNNREKVLELWRRYDETHREERLAKWRAYRESNPDKIRRAVKRWADAHKAEKRLYMKAWQSRNRAKVFAYNSIRRAEKLRATPVWLTSEHISQIEAIYAEAVRRSSQEGVKYHVDHIVPLRGNSVCGLHVPWNLQVITARENLIKYNRLE